MPLYDFSLDIGPNEGFTPEKDIFGHKAFGERLTNLLANTNFPITLAIDAQWGEGKTTFLKMWAGHLRNEGFPVIEFDSFVNDYYDDPFIPLAGELVALAHKNGIKAGIANKAKKVGIALAKGAAKIGVKALTLNALDNQTLEGIKEDVADGLADYTAKEVGELIDRYNTTKNEFESFRDALRNLPAKLHAGPKHDDGQPINSKPLVFIIDELDRCRPDYALRLLERVKHFYSVENVHFVFGAHISSIENSVLATYGKNINAALYLQKFFTIKCNLPNQNNNKESNKSVYLKNLNKIFNIRFDIYDLENYLIEENISLRKIEKIFSQYMMIHRDERYESLSYYLLLLCIIRNSNQQMYQKILKGEMAPDEAGKVINKLYPMHPNAHWVSIIQNALTDNATNEVREAFGLRLMAGNLNAFLDNKFLSWETSS